MTTGFEYRPNFNTSFFQKVAFSMRRTKKYYSNFFFRGCTHCVKI